MAVIADPELIVVGGAAAAVVSIALWQRRVDGFVAGVSLVGAMALSERLEMPRLERADSILAASAAVLLGLGSRQMTRTIEPRILLVGAWISLVALWTAVPETGHVLTVGGATAVLAGWAALRGATAHAVAVAWCAFVWAAALGSAGGGWPLRGGLLTAGVALAWPIGQAARALVPIRWGLDPGWWLLALHGAAAFVAARWIGASASASAGRAAVVAIVLVVSAALVRPRSEPPAVAPWR